MLIAAARTPSRNEPTCPARTAPVGSWGRRGERCWWGYDSRSGSLSTMTLLAGVALLDGIRPAEPCSRHRTLQTVRNAPHVATYTGQLSMSERTFTVERWLDQFGSTVNIAARLRGAAEAAPDPDVTGAACSWLSPRSRQRLRVTSVPSGHDPAVDVPHRPGDPPGFVGEQEGHRSGHVLGLTDASNRMEVVEAL